MEDTRTFVIASTIALNIYRIFNWVDNGRLPDKLLYDYDKQHNSYDDTYHNKQFNYQESSYFFIVFQNSTIGEICNTIPKSNCRI